MNKKVLLSGLLLFFVGCANIYTARGVYHKMRPGETLEDLAKRHKASLQDLAELNNIEDPNTIQAGQNIFIPGARASRFKRDPFGFAFKETTIKKSSKGGDSFSEIHVDHERFVWPVNGRLSSTFGARGGRHHDGIDISADRGTPIRAADAGTVEYDKRLRGYGNLIILRHEDDFYTVYAHNSVNLVKTGALVKRGQQIAKVGSTGKASGPHLHFEVRKGRKPRNPLFFLPKRRR